MKDRAKARHRAGGREGGRESERGREGGTERGREGGRERERDFLIAESARKFDRGSRVLVFGSLESELQVAILPIADLGQTGLSLQSLGATRG